MSRFLVLLVAGLIATLGVACDNDEEAEPTGAPTSVASASATLNPSLSASVKPSPSATVPADWLTYEDSQGRYKLRYPQSWFEGDSGDLYSYDPSSHNVYSLPPEVIEIEIGYSPAVGSDVCGAVLKTDVETGEAVGLLPGAEPATLGGIDGGRITRVSGDPAIEGSLTRIDGTGLVYQGSCVLFTAYYTQQKPDSALVSLIASSFSFQASP